MANRIVERMRRIVEARLPWFDRTDQDRRARRTQRIHNAAISARVRGEIAISDPFSRELDAAITSMRRGR